jgi:hypothetical protein
MPRSPQIQIDSALGFKAMRLIIDKQIEEIKQFVEEIVEHDQAAKISIQLKNHAAQTHHKKLSQLNESLVAQIELLKTLVAIKRYHLTRTTLETKDEPQSESNDIAYQAQNELRNAVAIASDKMKDLALQLMLSPLSSAQVKDIRLLGSCAKSLKNYYQLPKDKSSLADLIQTTQLVYRKLGKFWHVIKTVLTTIVGVGCIIVGALGILPSFGASIGLIAVGVFIQASALFPALTKPAVMKRKQIATADNLNKDILLVMKKTKELVLAKSRIQRLPDDVLSIVLPGHFTAIEQSKIRRTNQLLNRNFYHSAKETAFEHFLELINLYKKDKIEKIIKTNPELLYKKGNLTDSAGRTFKNIYPLQYILWSLNTPLLEIICKYLPTSEVKRQYNAFKSTEFVEQHGQYFERLKTVNAYTAYHDLQYRINAPIQHRDDYWSNGVGQEQREWPVNLMQDLWRSANTESLYPLATDVGADLTLVTVAEPSVNPEWENKNVLIRAGQDYYFYGLNTEAPVRIIKLLDRDVINKMVEKASPPIIFPELGLQTVLPFNLAYKDIYQAIKTKGGRLGQGLGYDYAINFRNTMFGSKIMSKQARPAWVWYLSDQNMFSAMWVERWQKLREFENVLFSNALDQTEPQATHQPRRP